MNMDLLITTAIFKIFIATVAACAVFATLRFYDWVTGTKWGNDVKADMGEIYYGCRFLAVCLLYGLVLAFG